MKTFALALAALLLPSSRALAADEAFQLFEQEAKVVSASYAPTTAAMAPATVRVVTAEDIAASGARTVWDALRRLPGVDVMQTRAGQAELGVRGLNAPLNDRILILLDGLSVLNPMFDYMTWETLPVTLEEIERIEVVEGPASALYGANAVGGVVDIITKSPARLDGGRVTAAGGAGGASGSALYGRRAGRLDYKFSAGAQEIRRFEDESLPSSRSRRVHAALGWEPSPGSRVSAAAGATLLDARTTTGSPGAAFETGGAGFLRADYRRGDTSVRGTWNRERAVLREFSALGAPSVDYDAYELSARRSESLPGDHDLTFGGSARRDAASSSVLAGGRAAQDLWALFVEDQWTPSERWTLTVGGRVDRHPLTPLSFSPRAGLAYSPDGVQTFRASAGTSFRNPTLVESYLRYTQTVPNPGGALPNPPFTAYTVSSAGRTDLEPEKMFSAELGHSARLGRLQTGLTGWYYRLRDRVVGTTPTLAAAVPPTASLASTFVNHGGVSALGLEASLEARLSRDASAFANWSYQSLRADDPASDLSAVEAPRHKVNAGVSGRRGGWSASLWGGWTDARARNESAPGAAVSLARVPDELLVHGRLAYAFSGGWDGLELGVSAFDLLDRRAAEALAPSGASTPGDNAEPLRRRVSATASYRF
jgi:outer membrane receptor for ferrienterochelin and colicin